MSRELMYVQIAQNEASLVANRLAQDQLVACSLTAFARTLVQEKRNLCLPTMPSHGKATWAVK